MKLPGELTLETLREEAAAGRIDTVLACMVDMQGRLMGKRFHARHFADEAWEETHCCNYLLATDMEMATVGGYAATGWAAGYGDYVMRPDLDTLRRAAWLDATAIVLCDVLHHDTHRPVRHSPRAVLQAQVARLHGMGMRAMMATELEFFLFEGSYRDMADAGYRGLRPIGPYNEDYHIFQTTKEEDVMRAIRNGLHDSGIPVENSKGEAEAGQEEINVRYADALRTGDNHAITKNACKEIAWSKGRALTFLAKWHHARAGSSCHVHQSLRDEKGGDPLFWSAKGEHGMSDLMRHYVAGLLAHSGEITLFLAPYVNSYKRFVAETFAPTRAVWSRDNRTAGYRLCGEGTKAIRIECRIGGSDLNPYMAMAAMLAAGIDGIDKEMKLEPAASGDLYRGKRLRQIPGTLREAVDAAAKSRFLREALGEDVVAHYCHAARHEISECDRVVTDWEVARGFERA